MRAMALMAVVAGAIALPAAAQQLPESVGRLSAELQAMALSQQHVVEKTRDVVETLVAKDKRIADIEAYAKACGDKPGCFVPIVEPPK